MTPEEEAMTKRILELKALLPAENGGGLPAPSGVKAPPSQEVITTNKAPQQIIVPPKNPPAKVVPPSVKTNVVPRMPGKTGKSMSGLGDIVAGTALATMAATELLTGDEEAPAQDAGLAEVPPEMLERPNRDILDEKWDDVKGDRMGDPESRGVNEVGGTKWETLEDFLKWERQEEIRERTKPGFGMQRERDAMGGGPLYSDMSDMDRWAARESDDGGAAEREARTEWAQERQAVRADDKEWGMKSTMPPEVLADYESKTPEEQRQFYAIWYKNQRARGLNPGDTDSNLSANAGMNENFDENRNPRFKENEMPPDAVAEMLRQDNIENEEARKEKFANNLERVEANKEREADRLHAYRNWMMEGSAFGHLPYAQRVAIGRHITTAADPNAPLEARDVANRRLLSMGILANGGVVAEAPMQFPGMGGSGQGGQGSEPSANDVRAAKRETNMQDQRDRSDATAQADGNAVPNSPYLQKKIDDYWNTNTDKGTWADLEQQIQDDPETPGKNDKDARRQIVENEIAHSIVTGIQKNWMNLPKDSIDRLKSAMIQLGVPGMEAGKTLTWEQFEEFAGKWIPANKQARKDLKSNFEAITKEQIGAEAGGGFFGANDLGQPDALIA
jgi:hypothetical protein